MYEIITLKYIFTSTISIFVICFTVLNIRYLIKVIYTTNMYKYKINNFLLTTAIAFLYVFIFVIIFYALRLLNLGKYLDLKLLYNNITLIWNTLITPLSLTIKIPLISLSFILLINFCILFLLIIKTAILEIYKLYIYILFKPLNHFLNTLRKHIKKVFGLLGDSDIFSFLLHQIIKTISLKYKNKNKYPEEYSYFLFDINNVLVSNRFYNNKYRLFIQISPIFFVIYDCIFNNFVIIHFYCFMLIYVPTMLLRNITTAVTETNDSFVRVLWKIYYEEKQGIIYIATKEEKDIIDIFIKANLSYVKAFLLTMVEFHLENAITYYLEDHKENIYYNSNTVYLKVKNNTIFEVTEDDFGNVVYKETTEYLLLKQFLLIKN